MRIADVCRPGDGHLDVDVSVSPRSSRPGLDGFDEWRRRLVVRVSAPPLDGRANREVCELLSGITGGPCEVISGQTSRQKTVRIRGDPDAIVESLEAAYGRRGEAGGDPRGDRQAPRVGGG